ncbi:MAG: DEAD/DEAH box helicase [Burkholderiaceae bacterium]|nr:DEAD/DEAH box helicase [Burkholderiaceae bacterium]
MLNPITYTEQVVSDFLRYQLSTYAFADEGLYAQMRKLLNLEHTRATPLLKGPFVSLSRTFRQGASLDQLIAEGVLHPHIKQLSPYPTAYGHQEQAFRAIHAGKTTLVATGTGSGKTECFLLPIVSRCLALRDAHEPAGVTAVIVYPMNALAEDQLQRMRELLAGTGVSFGMYVGKTPQTEADIVGVRLPAGSSAADYRAKLADVQKKKLDVAVHPPEERVSREEMRTPGKQPRILLTNVKQLELLLTRQRDLELFDGARLEYLVFDEAHTFSGAQGAETACLIRRLRAYCGKTEASTTCIATSATIADPVKGLEAGRLFASRFFGVDGAAVELVGESYEADVWGEPRTASGPLAGDQALHLQNLLAILTQVDRDDATEADIQALRIWFQTVTGTRWTDGHWRHALHRYLSHNEVVYQIAEKLRRPRPLSELVEDLGQALGRAISEEEILIWLALGAAARTDTRPLLRPVVHGFVRGVSGAVVTFPEPTREARLWLSAEDALAQGDDLQRFPVLSCTTCGQHYFEHGLEDFHFTGLEPGGGQAEGEVRAWRPMDKAHGGMRAVSLDHLVGSDGDDDAPPRTQTLYVCRYCGAAHSEPVDECVGCGRNKPMAALHFVQQKEDQPGYLARCVSCGASGRRFIGQYREPARPVRATTVADVHVLAQSMIHRAERRRLLVFADNRQDAAFQAGWMQDRSRRFRLRELLYKKIKQGPVGVGDLTLWLDQFLDADDELSRALIPEVWRVVPKSQTSQAHAGERKWFIRAQLLRELALGARQRIGLEPWGRMKVQYQGLDPELPLLLKWSHRIGCKPQDLAEGVASLLDAARSRKILFDRETLAFSKVWMDGVKEVMQGYLPSMKDVPKGLKFQRDGQDDQARLMQWYSNYDTAAKQAAVAWGVAPDDVKPFLEDVWALLSQELKLLVPVQLKGGRGNPLPHCAGAYQVDADRLMLTPHKGTYMCGNCRRLHSRPTPNMRCMAYRCTGTLAWKDEDPDSYELLLLDQEFAMLRAREHSAQIPGPDRERIENAFKSDNERINTLVCTPTLEMGVNIGTLDAVLMRNVPPLPANYWQRAGRAGRQFRMALDLTYARAASHDRAYFNEPLKMLEGLVEPPSFNLRNAVMVRKHVHATVLTALFKMLRDEQLPGMELEQLKEVLGVCFPRLIKPYLFTAEGFVRPEPLDVSSLGVVVKRYEAQLIDAVHAAFRQGWPAEDQVVVAPEQISRLVAGLSDELQEVVKRLYARLQWALGQLNRLQKVAQNKGALDADEEALRYRCERLVKKLKGETRRRASQAEGVDDINTYGVLAAEGFLPGYGLDTGAITVTHEAPRYGSDIQDWELRRSTSVAIREYVPGNLIYANGHKFVARRFHLEPEDPLAFSVDVSRESVQEAGGVPAPTDATSTLGAVGLLGIAMCDVDAPHQSYISDEEDYRYQMPVAVFGHEQGRHGGGYAFEWGPRPVHLKRGVHMRLVNVGAAAKVRSQGLLGYPICLVCGHTRSPLSHAKEIDEFNKHHTERCGRPIEFVSFYAEVVSDALTLPECASKEVAYSVLEALRQGAAEVLDMEMSDLQILVFGKPGVEEVDGLLYDPMPGGSGLLEQIVRRWSDVVAAAIALVTGCASACESSCVDCLQHFRNAFYHDSLNRHVALDCLRDWGTGLVESHPIPPVLPDDTLSKTPANGAEAQLGAMLTAAGLEGFETDRPIKLSGGVTTRPDVYFHQPNEQFEGVCVYLDGMSGHIHGNAETMFRDRQIRDELRSKDYEVVEITYQQLFDKSMMRVHMRKIAKAVVGRGKAKEVEEDDSWFSPK